MKKRLLSLALVLALCLGLAAPAFAEEGDLFPATGTMPGFSDVAQGGTPGGPWYDYESIRVCVEAGLMQGSGGAFRPGSPITIAEVAVIAARMCAQTYETAIPQGSNWYDGHIQLLKDSLQELCDLFNQSTREMMEAEGLSEADLTGLFMDPETQCPALFKDPLSPATREDFVYLLNQGVLLTEQINHISRLPDTRDPVVLGFYNAGILTGTNERYGDFEGDKGLTRAEAAAMVARVVRPALRRELSFRVPDAGMGEAQAAWQQSHSSSLDTNAMFAVALAVNGYTGLSLDVDKDWFCLDFGVSGDSVLLHLDGEGGLSASYLLPFFSILISENVASLQEGMGYTEAQFWSSTFTPAALGTSLDAEAYMKYTLERVLATMLLKARGNDNPDDGEIAALRAAFAESPDFQALSPRALYEFAAANYPAALYTAEDWAGLMGA